MPHFQIEYSRNLEEIIDVAKLCDAIRAAACEIEAFPTAGIRVRAVCADHYSIADGNPKHGFIDLSVRLREGRSQEIKQEAITEIFETLRQFVAPAMNTHSIALSAEMRDINAALSPKFGNIRDYLE